MQESSLVGLLVPGSLCAKILSTLKEALFYGADSKRSKRSWVSLSQDRKCQRLAAGEAIIIAQFYGLMGTI